jgi:hypothetical protein
MKKKLFIWDAGGILFIAIFGTSLHFFFELSNFWKPVVIIAAVNESTWEHLKMAFWQGLFIIFSQKYSRLCIST